MAGLKVIVFLGTVRENRLGIRIANFIINHLKATNHQVELFDPMEMQFPVIQTPLHFYKDKSEAPKWMVEAEQRIRDADGYVLVAGEYNCTIPPALTNMMDHFPPSAYSHKPSAIVTYSPGSWGGIRSGIALRPFLLELGSVTVPAILTIPQANKAIDPEGKPSAEQQERLDKNAKRMIGQLDWYAEAMKKQRDSKGLPQ